MGDINSFFAKFDDLASWSATKQVDYAAYFLLTAGGKTSVVANDLAAVLRQLDLKEYKRLPQYLSENATAKTGRYVKVKQGGYRLARAAFDVIDKQVRNEPVKVAVSAQLADLVAKIANASEKAFVEEALNCYRVGANRATVIMMWITAIEHIQRYTFANKLADFNAALAKSPDKKVKKIINYDDFSDLPEVKLIELLRSAGVITNDIRKLLDEKLGIRNSAAHPSGVTITGHKATEFALDITANVLLNFS